MHYLLLYHLTTYLMLMYVIVNFYKKQLKENLNSQIFHEHLREGEVLWKLKPFIYRPYKHTYIHTGLHCCTIIVAGNACLLISSHLFLGSHPSINSSWFIPTLLKLIRKQGEVRSNIICKPWDQDTNPPGANN